MTEPLLPVPRPNLIHCCCGLRCLCTERIKLDIWICCGLRWWHLVLGENRLLRLAWHWHHACHRWNASHHRTHLLLLRHSRLLWKQNNWALQLCRRLKISPKDTEHYLHKTFPINRDILRTCAEINYRPQPDKQKQ